MILLFLLFFLDCETWTAPSQIDSLTPSAEGFFQTDAVDNCRYVQFTL